MAKNNFKKKKTLKRSLRRNYTKKVASALLGSRTLNIRKKNRRSQKQRTTLRNKRNTRVKIGGVWFFGKSNAERERGEEKQKQREAEERQREAEERQREAEERLREDEEAIKNRKERDRRSAEREKEVIQKGYYLEILPTIKKISEEMARVRNDEDAIHLFGQVNTLIKTSPGLSKEDEDSVKYKVMKAFKSAKELNNFETQIYRWYSGDYIDYRGAFYTQF